MYSYWLSYFTSVPSLQEKYQNEEIDEGPTFEYFFHNIVVTTPASLTLRKADYPVL